MKDKIVTTDNMMEFVAAVERLETKPERLDRMGLAYGKWGLGKTTTVEWYYTNNSCFYVRAMAAWSRSPGMMIEDILRAYRIEARGRFKQDIRELVRAAKKQRLPLFIDEADRVVRKSLLIETIRDVHDLAKVPIILVGQENIINLLQRRDLGQVFSRITEIVEFTELSAQDIQRVAEELCSLKCDLKVASFIKTITLGDFRLTNALLTRAENLCNLNKIEEITLTIAKESSSALPGSDEDRRSIKHKDSVTGENVAAIA
jgi:DNA transposition AAA+ family ATPase